MHRHDLDHPPLDHGDPVLRLLSFVTAALVAGLLVFRPQVALDRWGVADPAAAFCLLWSMAAGFASALRLAPPGRAMRRLLSSEACLLALVGALLQIAGH